MNELTVLEIAKEALTVGFAVSAPLLLSSLVVGAVVGVLMAATQVQEFTLTFVPKLLTLGLVLMITGPWMLRSLVAFAQALFAKLPAQGP